MEYFLENDYLKVTVTTFGAQVKSVIRKCDGVEHMWKADKNVWGYHAPVLFPHCGKVTDGIIEAKGAKYKSAQHGFADCWNTPSWIRARIPWCWSCAPTRRP